jgi:hypothetical protein
MNKGMVTAKAQNSIPQVFLPRGHDYDRGVADALVGKFAPPTDNKEAFDAYCYGAATANALVAKGN